ncbi:MAG: hypothetical protein JRN16_02685 [Nitrososphaerota archaeon]|nr:hypothetical protein [Nitrososphaerota archaeon]
MQVAIFLSKMGYVVAAVISILIGEVVNYGLSVTVPNLYAPIGLFPLYTETIGIDVYGAFFPVFLSIGLFLMLRRLNIPNGLKPCRGRRFWLSVGVVTLVFVMAFAYLRLGVGIFSLTLSEAAFIVPSSGFFGVLYSVRRRYPASLVGIETYIVGVFGVFLSDLFLSFSGISQAPGEAIVWGGSGFHDLVLWFGLYLAVPAFCFVKLSPRVVLFFRNLGSVKLRNELS